MSEGTPLDDLESGNVANEADAAKMREILRDIDAPNASDEMAPARPSRNEQHMQQPPMHMYNPNVQQQQRQGYTPIDEEVPVKPKKKNIWSSLLEGIRDPIIVAILVFVLSLPALHTFAGKYTPWAFAVGGQLSWIGLGAMSFVAALMFGSYRGVLALTGM